MDCFELLSLDDTPPKKRLHKSMSFSEISPRKEVTISQKVISGQSQNTVLQQYSYHELGVIPGTSLRYSKKFVSEFHIDLSGCSEILPLENKLSEMKSDVKENERHINSKKIKIQPSNKRVQRLKRSHIPSNSDEDFRRKKIFKVTSSLRNTEDQNMTFNRNMLSDSEKVHPRTITQLLFVIVPILLAALATHYVTYQRICNMKFDVNASEYLLNTRLFGQNEAVKSIVDTLKKFNSTDQKNGLQVIVLTGATGVGKTYTASLLEETFPWKHNIHNLIMPIDFQTLPQYLKQKYPYCVHHLVVIDDLRVEDIENTNLLVSHLQSLAEQNKVLAVLIFKFHKQLSSDVCEYDIQQKCDEVQRNLIQSNVNFVMINFKSLDRNTVILCIKEALTRHWIPISAETIGVVLDQVDYHSEGCKRISSKIAVVNQLWVREKEDI